MPSADFCTLTRHVAMKGASGLSTSCCLFRVSHRDSHLSTADGCAGYLVNRVNLFRYSLMNLLPRDMQTSPDKNVNFPCTSAAFTLSPEPVGFAMIGWLARRLGLLCGFCPSSRTFALRLRLKAPTVGFRPLLAETPLPWYRTFGSIHHMNTSRFSYRGLAPRKLTPMPGVPSASSRHAPLAPRAADAQAVGRKISEKGGIRKNRFVK